MTACRLRVSDEAEGLGFGRRSLRLGGGVVVLEPTLLVPAEGERQRTRWRADPVEERERNELLAAAANNCAYENARTARGACL